MTYGYSSESIKVFRNLTNGRTQLLLPHPIDTHLKNQHLVKMFKWMGVVFGSEVRVDTKKMRRESIPIVINIVSSECELLKALINNYLNCTTCCLRTMVACSRKKTLYPSFHMRAFASCYLNTYGYVKNTNIT